MEIRFLISGFCFGFGYVGFFVNNNYLSLFVIAIGILTVYFNIKSIGKKEKKNKDTIISDSYIFLYKNGLKAKSVRTKDGLIIQKGSFASIEHNENLSKNCIEIKQQLLVKSILLKNDSKYIFTKNFLIEDPSQAAKIITGLTRSNTSSWKNCYGENLTDLEEKSF